MYVEGFWETPAFFNSDVIFAIAPRANTLQRQHLQVIVSSGSAA